MGECKCDCETTLNSLMCVAHENYFSKNELCRKEKAAGTWMCGGRGGVRSAKREGVLLVTKC